MAQAQRRVSVADDDEVDLHPHRKPQKSTYSPLLRLGAVMRKGSADPRAVNASVCPSGEGAAKYSAV